MRKGRSRGRAGESLWRRNAVPSATCVPSFGLDACALAKSRNPYDEQFIAVRIVACLWVQLGASHMYRCVRICLVRSSPGWWVGRWVQNPCPKYAPLKPALSVFIWRTRRDSNSRPLPSEGRRHRIPLRNCAKQPRHWATRPFPLPECLRSRIVQFYIDAGPRPEPTPQPGVASKAGYVPRNHAFARSRATNYVQVRRTTPKNRRFKIEWQPSDRFNLRH
jgi:hypothetical protein